MAGSPKSVWQDYRGFIVVSRKRISFILSAVFCFTCDIGGVLNRMRRPAKTDFAPAHIPEPKMWFFVIGGLLKEPLNNSLHAQSFRLVRNLGAILMACWLPVEKLQRRVRASLEDPEGET